MICSDDKLMESEMGRTLRMHGEKRNAGFCGGNVKEGDHLKDLGVDGG
jgi:prepilin-type processing-associated H-X9-DG protein